MTENKNGVVYIRISTDEQTIDTQKEHVESFAKFNNIKILKIYIDEDKSGYSNARPEFQNMIEFIRVCNEKEQIEENRIHYILCYDIGRISRDFDMLSYFPYFGKMGAVIASSSNNKFYTGFLTDDPEEQFIEGIHSIFSFYEGKKIRKRLSHGYNRKRAEAIINGEPWGRPVKELTLNKNQILAMLRSGKFSKIFVASSAGISKSTLNNYLKEWGVYEEFKRKVNPNSLKNLLNIIPKAESETNENKNM